MQLTPVMAKFVRHWGEMGSRWGINRTVAQVHALLYLSAEPLPADAITHLLGVARSNVSTSLKELQSWRLVRRVHVPGDRRNHFQCVTDGWEMFQIVLDERKRREVDPTIALLHACVDEARQQGEAERHTHRRLNELLDFFLAMDRGYHQLRDLPRDEMVRFMKMGRKVQQVLSTAE